MALVKYLLYTRWGEFVKELVGIESAEHRQEINGEDTLAIEVREVLAKGDRILWHDGAAWHEHVVDESTQSHTDGETFSVTCNPALMDLRLQRIEGFEGTYTAQAAMEAIFAGVGAAWALGTVGASESQEIKVDSKTAYDALLSIAGTFGFEVSAVIEVGDSGVTSRRVNLVEHVGSDRAARFEYGHNMEGVTKHVLSDEVYTQVFGYGKDGLVVECHDDEAAKLWGLPDGEGGRVHAQGSYENSECSNKVTLISETADYLAAHNAPAVSYETEIPTAQLMGVRLGDTVQVIDNDFSPPLRLETRIGALTRDLVSGDTSQATFGTVTSYLPDVLSRTFASVKSAENAVSELTPEKMMQGMNGIYDEGKSYVCQTATDGIVTANVPLDSEGNPTVTTGDLVAKKIANGVIYSSTSVDSDGKWVWVISENQELEYLTNKDFLAKFGVEVESDGTD